MKIETNHMNLQNKTPEKTHKLLVLEDSELDFALLDISLKKFFGSLDVKLEISRASNKTDFEKKFLNEIWDCVVTDFNIPGYSALDAIDLVCHKSGSDCQILVFSGAIGEEMTVEIM